MGNVKSKGSAVGSTKFAGESILLKKCTSEPWIDPRIYFCPDSCWRHVSLALNDEIGNINSYTPVSLKFTNTQSGDSFIEQPEDTESYLGGYDATKLVTKIMPSGEWKVELLDRDEKLLPSSAYDSKFFTFVRTDTILKYVKPACTDDVSFVVNGLSISEATTA